MPAITWPTDVSNCLSLDTYFEEPQPVIVRSPVESGPYKVRRRYTQPIIGIVGNITCDKDELNSLMNFFNVTLQGGSLEFENTNSISGATHKYRFLQPPRMTGVVTAGTYNVELIMEQY